ncbi:PHA/PHB synthase family protein [Chelatococcus reniformis]|uniref:Poly-beta-hydroxybutyrate polymerase n=1 Tax=Chelatococcus reniformis TaxID=1494448 RepID=A0A916UG50_9HYPH|nr:class I poly(R)-hydroxyalkanoic acid synthase [Chelatococcus reniformis]GGC71491.1 poly-beta-hydroxybutyrate polymerase [Chelatococcus reniformis]
MTKNSDAGSSSGNGPTPFPLPDFEALSENMARLIEESGKATAAYLKPIEERRTFDGAGGEAAEVVKTLGQVAERWFTDPTKAIEAQSQLANSFVDLWGSMLKRMQGETAEPIATPDRKDQRFADPGWSDLPFFDFLKQAYLLTSKWAENLVENAEGLDDHTRLKARFYVKQLSGALSPSNFLLTNPELIRETVRQNGANLVRGMKMLAEDVAAGHGELKVRQTDATKFEIGVNVAVSPGKVVFRNDLIELIQYAPATETVLKRPLLVVPPWINKYYILDLNAEKSFIGWAVSQGLTVFVVSWVNPDERYADKGWQAYMQDGILAAIDAVQQATGEEKITTIGYCVGGTLLALTLAYMAQKGDDRIDSATFFTAQVDFTHAGDLLAFVDEDQLKNVDALMRPRGFLEGSRMAAAFNMLRPNDLIWPYVINVYMKGNDPFPFDLLYWNSDSTRLTAANHSFYLRTCYLENRLVKGEVELGGTKLDLKKVTIPIYNLAAREDHIAPARSVLKGSAAFGGPVKLVVAGSGHIAGVVNPPALKKYQYWAGPAPTGTLEDWLEAATETPGSWWPNWFAWVEAQAPQRIPAAERQPGNGQLKAICEAPGEYVKARV